VIVEVERTMSTDAETVYQAAMRLSEDERVELAGKLLEGTDSGFDPEWEAAWRDEILRRDAELRSGAVQTVPWSAVKKTIQEARHGKSDSGAGFQPAISE
jgi:putative addiction module component (TIGR02574 family)